MNLHHDFVERARGTLDRINERMIHHASEEVEDTSKGELQFGVSDRVSEFEQAPGHYKVINNEFYGQPHESHSETILAFRQQIERFRDEVLSQPIGALQYAVREGKEHVAQCEPNEQETAEPCFHATNQASDCQTAETEPLYGLAQRQVQDFKLELEEVAAELPRKHEERARLRISWSHPVDSEIPQSKSQVIRDKAREIREASFSTLQLSSDNEAAPSADLTLRSTLALAQSTTELRTELAQELGIPDGPMANVLIAQRVRELTEENQRLERQNDYLVAKVTEILGRCNVQ